MNNIAKRRRLEAKRHAPIRVSTRFRLNMSRKLLVTVAILSSFLLLSVCSVLLRNRRLHLPGRITSGIQRVPVPNAEAIVFAEPTLPRESPVSPKETIVEDWKTYHSQRFNFSFGNPAEYILDTTAENVYKTSGHINFYDKYSWYGMALPIMSISAYENTLGLSSLEWAQADVAHSNFAGSYTTRDVAGEKAIAYSWTGGGGKGYTIVVMKHGSNYIVTIVLLDTRQQAWQDFEQLVSTFRFTD